MIREEILSVAKPILFNTDMVMAILEGRKSVTRRVMKPQPLFKTHRKFVFDDDTCPRKWEDCDDITKTYQYQQGDFLYIRETWRVSAAKRYESLVRIGYRAGGKITTIHFPNGCTDSIDRVAYDAFVEKWLVDRWYPSIHMPKEASRIFLRVTDVRVERLQDMTSDDAEKEGCGEYLTESKFRVSTLGHFMEIWDSTIHKKDLDKHGWSANPWVWVIQFERVEVQND